MNKFMKIAYKEALNAYKKNEIPVGAVIVHKNKVIAKANNNRQRKHNLLGHAEIMAIIKAEKKIKDWRLDSCDMYVTLSPCEMCKIFIKESRISNVYYLINQKNVDNYENNIKRTNDCKELQENYELILKKFFDNLRK